MAFPHSTVHACVTTFTTRVSQNLSVPITTDWKELRRSNLHHSAPLEMPFPVISFFAEIGSIKVFRFWLKTMDYNKAF